MKAQNMKLSLKNSKNNREAVSLYANRNEPEMFSCGFIEEVTDKHILLQSISTHGLYDGYLVRRFEDVFRIDINGRYESRLKKLYCLQEQEHETFLNKKNTTNLVKDVLTLAKERSLFVKISIDETLEQEDITGLVKSISTTEVSIEKISYEGYNDGEANFFINEIVQMNCDSIEERLLQKLYNSSKIL